jgi:hypothetical protein
MSELFLLYFPGDDDPRRDRSSKKTDRHVSMMKQQQQVLKIVFIIVFLSISLLLLAIGSKHGESLFNRESRQNWQAFFSVSIC